MPKDDATWLRIAYVVFFLLMTYIGSSAANMLGIQMGWVERYDNWYPFAQLSFGFLVGAILTYVTASNSERHEYYLASLAELRKVTWPSWPDVKRMTIIVCVVVAFFSAVLGIFDLGFAKVLSFILV